MKEPQPIEVEAAEVEMLIDLARQGLLDAAAQKRIVLAAGDRRPACERGRLSPLAPLVRLRFTGQPLSVARYELERLRCGACGALWIAHLPVLHRSAPRSTTIAPNGR